MLGNCGSMVLFSMFCLGECVAEEEEVETYWGFYMRGKRESSVL